MSRLWQMVVFGDSNGDTGRRFNAPASFEFEDIGRWPWRRMFDGPDSDVRQPCLSQNFSPEVSRFLRLICITQITPLSNTSLQTSYGTESNKY